MIEAPLAAIVLAICIALLARMLLRPARRERLDRALQRAWWWSRDALQRLLRRPHASSADAEREARDAIERASRKRTLH